MTAARELDQPLLLPKTLRGVNIEFKADRPITEEELLEFCVENDHLRIEQDKIRLAWLIDPLKEKTWIYREDGSVEEMKGFDQVLSGEGVCPGLELDLRKMRM